MKKIIKKLFPLVFLMFSISMFHGCASQQKASFVLDKPVPIIGDVIINRLMDSYPPAQTQLNLLPSGNKVFDRLLVNKARQAGYGISTDAHAIEVTYIIDKIEGTASSYLHLKTSTGLKFSRAFDSASFELANFYTETALNELE